MTNNRPRDDRPHYGQQRHHGRAVAAVAVQGSSGSAGQHGTVAAAVQQQQQQRCGGAEPMLGSSIFLICLGALFWTCLYLLRFCKNIRAFKIN